MGAIVSLSPVGVLDGANLHEMVQSVAFSFKMNEVGGPDENLAAFRSTDGGSNWLTRSLALAEQTLPNLLTIFFREAK